MNIQPKKIESGFLLRYAKQSIALFFGAPVAWVIVLLGLWGVGELGLNSITSLLIGMFFMIIGIEISHYSYNRSLSFNDFFILMKESFLSWLLQINYRLYFLIIIMLVFVFLDYRAEIKSSAISLTEVAKKAEEIKNELFFKNSYWVIAFGLVAISGFGIFNIFSHLFYRFFSLMDKQIIRGLCEKAAKLNKGLVMANEFMLLFLLLILGSLIPYAMLAIYPIYSGMVYLAFREIFLEDKKKVEQEEKIENINFLPNV